MASEAEEIPLRFFEALDPYADGIRNDQDNSAAVF